uniref:Uncharacterized protein n=1 Tax=Lepeophtheirus salmonis TaxID=72036 RepID=A0A0K2V0K4_LEPSM
MRGSSLTFVFLIFLCIHPYISLVDGRPSRHNRQIRSIGNSGSFLTALMSGFSGNARAFTAPRPGQGDTLDNLVTREAVIHFLEFLAQVTGYYYWPEIEPERVPEKK